MKRRMIVCITLAAILLVVGGGHIGLSVVCHILQAAPLKMRTLTYWTHST